jgi:nitroimidazol reductase NimA-like FMN-containing flavoprotein (pyridoxamine 5'-phosphate oxidase superfamily)
MGNASDNGSPMSGRTTVRRGANRAEYRLEEMYEILRAGSVAHVAVITEEGPLVLPMVYGIGEGVMYLHGALANSLLKAGANTDICATVTILDGLVYAKTPFNHSMNYRSVVVRGAARIVSDEQETLQALQLMTDHVVPTWDITRQPSASEIRATRIIALPLTEMSAKVRAGGAINVPEDEGVEYWSGYVPVSTIYGAPISNEDAGAEMPEVIRNLEGRDLHQ